MKIKNKKSEYRPTRVLGKNRFAIAWDFQPLMKNGKETNLGTWEEHIFDHKPLEEEVKDVVLDYYNGLVDGRILSGYTWNGMNVWLSSENQFNYKAAYDIAVQTNGMNLPLKFKFGSSNESAYHVFTTMEELQDFYMGAIAHIQNSLNDGWTVKDSVDWKIFEW